MATHKTYKENIALLLKEAQSSGFLLMGTIAILIHQLISLLLGVFHSSETLSCHAFITKNKTVKTLKAKIGITKMCYEIFTCSSNPESNGVKLM